ncbi:type cbb3 cytochrome oxidase biogenesis protein CcoG [Vibrio variabilis]|uniref:Type cbb3 cytochrome oxidase biogenesis protein CcoG n=1 Tax=Vibrio variabilis TaxID=990271 RepID=A0ABQ0JF17_9VIBR|nr:type cbb3 cytochrome oxidase biogenesis protein CcoG [Vibrio variabilis]
MSQDKIDVKDVTPKTFNPKTHKGNGDRFNPSNRIYVRESKGTFQKLRRYGGWFLLVLFAIIPWIPYGERQAVLLDIGNQQFNFFGTTFTRKISPYSPCYLWWRPLVCSLSLPF